LRRKLKNILFLLVSVISSPGFAGESENYFVISNAANNLKVEDERRSGADMYVRVTCNSGNEEFLQVWSPDGNYRYYSLKNFNRDNGLICTLMESNFRQVTQIDDIHVFFDPATLVVKRMHTVAKDKK
jgi:hypothetical protein